MKAVSFARALIIAAVLVTPANAEAAEPRQLLWQTNAEGNDIHVFDLAAGALVKRLEVGPEPHGIAATADHRTVFVTIEANGSPRGELLWIDAASFQVKRRMPLCAEPHALAATPDGAFLYIPCRDEHYWVVDGSTGAVIKKIKTGGRPHNTAISADGARAYLSPMGEPHAVTIVDVHKAHSPVGTIPFQDSVRPSALTRDGQLLFHHVDGINGFQMADTRRRDAIATVEHGTRLDGVLLVNSLGWLGFGGFERCHGIAVRPDQAEVWSVCADTVTVHAARSRFTERAAISLPGKGYWITFSPDARYACIALSDMGEVAVIDTATRSLVRRLKAGASPKRNLVLRHAS